LFHYAALEADFERYYKIDITEALYGDNRISVRKIINLWESLPHDCAIAREVDPGGAVHTRWTTTDHLLTLLSEQIDSLSSMFYSANSGKNSKKWKNIKHNRPKLPSDTVDEPVKKRSANKNEVLAILRGNI